MKVFNVAGSKLLLIGSFVACFGIMACSNPLEDLTKRDLDFGFDMPAQIKSQGDIVPWVYENITYVSDRDSHGKREFWQTPEETLSSRTGDCEDFVILAMAMYEAMGQSTRMIMTHYEGRPAGSHAEMLIEATGEQVDLVVGKFGATEPIDRTYTWEQVKDRMNDMLAFVRKAN